MPDGSVTARPPFHATAVSTPGRTATSAENSQARCCSFLASSVTCQSAAAAPAAEDGRFRVPPVIGLEE